MLFNCVRYTHAHIHTQKNPVKILWSVLRQTMCFRFICSERFTEEVWFPPLKRKSQYSSSFMVRTWYGEAFRSHNSEARILSCFSAAVPAQHRALAPVLEP